MLFFWGVILTDNVILERYEDSLVVLIESLALLPFHWMGRKDV